MFVLHYRVDSYDWKIPLEIFCESRLLMGLTGPSKAKKKKLDTKSAADLGLSASDLEPAVTLKAFGTPPGRPAGRILEGDAATTAKELVRLLREEAKVI